MKLRDRFWQWGHPEGCYNNGQDGWGHMAESRMTPMEGCLFLGISKTFMVPVGRKINRRQYNKSFKTLSAVGWECFGVDKYPEKVEQIIEESKEFPNITAAVLDDFVGKSKKRREEGDEVSADVLIKVRERFNNNEVRPIDLWMVLYTREFALDGVDDAPLCPFLDSVNGIILWTWEEKDIHLVPEKFEALKKLSPNTRKMFGCYLYNFGERKLATAKAVRWQLDFYREKILAGEAEGVVFHTNTMADLDYESYDAALEWMDIHGDEEID